MNEKTAAGPKQFIAVGMPMMIPETPSPSSEQVCRITIASSDWRQVVQLASQMQGVAKVWVPEPVVDGEVAYVIVELDVEFPTIPEGELTAEYHSASLAAHERAWELHRQLMTLVPGAPTASPANHQEATVQMFPPSIHKYKFGLTVQEIAKYFSRLRFCGGQCPTK